MGVTPLTAAEAAELAADSPVPEALQREYDRCAGSLYRFAAVRLGDAHLAEDCMQQLWLQASGARRTIPADQIEFWLRGILLNLIRTHWRRLKRRPPNVPLARPELAQELAERFDEQLLPEETLSRREVRDQVLLALTELEAADQELIVGFYFEQRPQAELAAELGLSARAIEGRLYRARRALRERLARLAADFDWDGAESAPTPERHRTE